MLPKSGCLNQRIDAFLSAHLPANQAIIAALNYVLQNSDWLRRGSLAIYPS